MPLNESRFGMPGAMLFHWTVGTQPFIKSALRCALGCCGAAQICLDGPIDADAVGTQ